VTKLSAGQECSTSKPEDVDATGRAH